MSGELLRRSAVAWAAVALLGAADGEVPVEFTRLLTLPSRTDGLQQPRTVHADLHTGEVFVADQRRGSVAIFDRDGLFSYEIRGGDTFRTPLDVAVWPDGWILMLAYTSHGRLLLKTDFDGRDVQMLRLEGLPPGLGEPLLVSIALSPDGERLYALDEQHLRLWIADREGHVRSSVDLTEGVADKHLKNLIFTRVDVYGDTVLVPRPSEGVIQLLDLDGENSRTVGIRGGASCETAFPVAAAIGMDGNVVMLDQQRALMMVWDPVANRCLHEISGIGARVGRLYNPADVALDGKGRLYVGQGYEGRVSEFAGAAPAEPPPKGAR